MGISYKAFHFRRTVFCAALALFSFGITSTGYAADDLFVVEGVTVDVTAADSVSAQQQAFAQAQGEAFTLLTQRMVESGGASGVQTPDPATISTLIQDYEVTNEQLSSTRYVGTYTFRFNQSEISKLLSGAGVKYTMQSSGHVLVLPYFQSQGSLTLWGEDNLWLAAWSGASLAPALVPVDVPIGDLSDVADMGDAQALNYDPVGLARIVERYGAQEAVIMIAVPDATLAAVADDGSPATGSLRVGIYRTDRVGAEHVHDLVVEADGSKTRSALYAAAVTNAYQALQEDWKSKMAAGTADSRKYQVRILLKSAQEWGLVQQALRSVTAISDLSVVSMKPSEARMNFTYRGDEVQLRDIMAQSGLVLGAGVADGAGVPSAVDGVPPAPVQDDLVYDLTLGQSNTMQHQGSDFYTPPSPAAGDENGADFGVQTF